METGFRAVIGTMATLILLTGLIGVSSTPAVAESIPPPPIEEPQPPPEVFYGDGCQLFEEGIYVIATETNPVEMYQNYTLINDYYKMLKEHVTMEASVEDFISILISRGICSSGGYGMKIKSIEQINYTFVLSANFTDPGLGVYVPLWITNPIALIPIGSLPAGEYSITLYIDRYIYDYFDGTLYYRYIGTETWTATFKCSAGWITATGLEVKMSIENKTTVLGEEILMFMVALMGTESSSSQIFDVYLYNFNYSLFSRWSQDKAFLCVMTHVDPGYNETLRWNLYRYDGGNYFPPLPGNYYLVGALMGNGGIRDVTPAILIKIDNSTITPIAEEAQPPLLELKTDKTVYALGENVTIILTNIGITYVQIGGYPCVEIHTYPEEEYVWPWIIAFLAWGLAPGESETWIWNQYNEFTQSPVEPGMYVVNDTQGWGLSTFFKIAPQPLLPGDADLNGLVELPDFYIWVKNFGNTPDHCPPGVYPDFDNNGLVDLDDFYIWRENFGAKYP